MNVNKIISLSKLKIDTEKGELLLESDNFILDIKDLDYKNSLAKISGVKIKNNKAELIESTGDRNSRLTRFLVNMHNIVYSEKLSDELYKKIINMTRKIIKERMN